MSTLRLMREQKLAMKRNRGRPAKVPLVAPKLKSKPGHISDDEEDNEDDESASIHSETENDDSDESDDKFLKNLEKKKQDQVDLEKMTRRQRMAYQAANATESAAEGIEFENEFIELETKRKDNDRSNKPKITQSQADEIRRKELDKILDEQLQKIKDKEKKMRAKEGAVNATG